MIGLVLVTHGRLAAEFVVAMEHVVGPQMAIEPICIGPDDDMELRRADIARAVAKVEDGSGVIVLTDLFGGTPSNLAISLMEPGKVEVIAGINLPMLMLRAPARPIAGVRRVRQAKYEGRPRFFQPRCASRTSRQRSRPPRSRWIWLASPWRANKAATDCAWV